MENKDPEEEVEVYERKPRLLYVMQFLVFIGLAFMGAYLFHMIAVAVLKPFTEYPFVPDQLEFFRDSSNIRYFWIYQGIVSIGTFGFPCLVFPLYHRERPLEYLGIKERPSLKIIGFAILLILLSQPLVTWIAVQNSSFSLPPGMEEIQEQLDRLHHSMTELQKLVTSGTGPLDLLMTLLVMAVIPAILEELFFRKAMLRILYDISRNSHVSIVLSSLLFALVHGEIYYFMPLFAMGLMLGYLALFSGNIWIPIVAHFINNALAVVQMKMLQRYPDTELLREEYQFPLVFILLSALCVIGLMWLIKRHSNSIEDGKGLD